MSSVQVEPLVPGSLTEPCEGPVGDLDKSPAVQQAVVVLAHLHDVGADRAADLVHFDGPSGVEPGDVPCVDGRVVPAERGAVGVPGFGGLIAAQSSRRIDPHVLNCFSVESPTEMQFAFRAADRAVALMKIDIQPPGADETAVQLQLGRQGRIRPLRMERFQHRRPSFGHGLRSPLAGRDRWGRGNHALASPQ